MLYFGESIPIVRAYDLFNITFITNTGAAWGILQGYYTLLVSVAVLVSAGCVWIIQTEERRLIRLSASFILGGGIGNMLDRLFTSSGVVDFIDIGVYALRWPTFNLADIMLSIGMIIFLFTLVREEFLSVNQSKDEPAKTHGQ